MDSKTSSKESKKKSQELCIDLPGETVQCWRSADHVKVVLRKHRDVFFDINIKKDTTYSVESTADYYSVRDKRLMRNAKFQDGEKFHLWIGRNFKGKLLLKSDGNVIGIFEPGRIDVSEYGTGPQIKPEPLFVFFGKKELSSSFVCKVDDPYGISFIPGILKPEFDDKLSTLKNFGTVFDYHVALQPPEIKEYVSVAEAVTDQLRPQILTQLNNGLAVEGKIAQIFLPPKSGHEDTGLYKAMASAATFISGNDFMNQNTFKETAGYLQENWRALDKITMTVRVEMRVTGRYRVLFKGRPLSNVAAQLVGAAGNTNVIHERAKFGSEKTAFLDGGFSRTGRSGYGGRKRILLTASENFRGGMKVQVIGTVIDIIGDANTVYFNEKGSKDFSEFLGRAGVTLVEAGVAALLGSIIISAITALIVSVLGSAAVPVLAVMAVAIIGYVIAASIVGVVDSELGIKTTIANWAK